jgi:hypothetical protein
MATTNPVNQLLVSSGNQAILAAGNRVDQLHNGQIGVFNPRTGLSIDGSVLGDAQEIFIAVGINRTSGGTAFMEDFNKSAGQEIQVRHAKSYTVKGTVDEVAKVVDIGGFITYCQTEYQLKVELHSHKVYGLAGYNRLSKLYKYYSGVCANPCAPDCGAGDNVEVAQGLLTDINADTDKVVTASLISYQILATVTAAATATASITVTIGTEVFVIPITTGDTAIAVAGKIVAFVNGVTTSAYKAFNTGAAITVIPKLAGVGTTATFALTNANGTGVTVGSISASQATVADSVAYKASFPGVSLGLRLTGNAEVRPAWNGSINPLYHKTGMDFIVTAVAGFLNNGTVNVTTNLQYREGYGYDLKNIEYESGGFNGKPGPYRASLTTGLPRSNFEYFITEASKYNLLVLSYDLESVGGWQEYKNNLETLIAIPCADTTTLTGLVAVLDLIFGSRFGPMTNDVASMNCSNTRTELLTPATDGIENLS